MPSGYSIEELCEQRIADVTRELKAEVELYKARWLSCVTQEEAERLRRAIETVRSLVHNLPRSATAESIDRVCANALGETDGTWPAEQGQFGVGA